MLSRKKVAKLYVEFGLKIVQHVRNRNSARSNNSKKEKGPTVGNTNNAKRSNYARKKLANGKKTDSILDLIEIFRLKTSRNKNVGLQRKTLRFEG